MGVEYYCSPLLGNVVHRKYGFPNVRVYDGEYLTPLIPCVVEILSASWYVAGVIEVAILVQALWVSGRMARWVVSCGKDGGQNRVQIPYRDILVVLGPTAWRTSVLRRWRRLLAFLYFLLCTFSCPLGCSELGAWAADVESL